ncbi:hypothetical protein [Mycobacteroides abscessus]|nr:hypothetical protein [Mycobacteroides abscessus]
MTNTNLTGDQIFSCVYGEERHLREAHPRSRERTLFAHRHAVEYLSTR